MKRVWFVLLTAALALGAVAEIQVINGKKYECSDGLCRLVEDAPEQQVAEKQVLAKGRLEQGYMSAEAFVAFVKNETPAQENDLWSRTGGNVLLILLLALVGGLAMNLTPCVLPMVPINLMVIGKSAWRGAAYGLGIALAYGGLGVAAAVGGLAFGSIQGSPWFNLGVALVFVVLGLALLEVFFLDFSRFRARAQGAGDPATRGVFFAFAMGALSAVLAGACVAPILVAVLLLTADLFAKGVWTALGLPFVLGLGMALPWPFAGAGLKVLPKPGGWMKGVNRFFAIVVFGFAVWYGYLAAQGFGWLGGRDSVAADARTMAATPATFAEVFAQVKRPVLVDCWASWCKNCAAMDRVLATPEVREALKDHAIIRLQAEDMSELTRLSGFESVKGLPAFVIFD